MSSLIPAGSTPHIINGNIYWVPNFAYGYVFSRPEFNVCIYSSEKYSRKLLTLIRRMIILLSIENEIKEKEIISFDT